MPEDLCACDQSAPPDLDAWRAEAGACAPLDAAASPAPWFFDSYSSVHSEPLTREHSRIEATIPDDAADDDPAWATLPETLVCRVPCVAGDTGTAQGRADGAWVAAARTGWPRDAARVGVLADRCAALEARIATLSALVAAGDRMEALAERFAARCEAWRTYALAVNVLRLSEGCVEEEEYARLHEEHDRAWQAVLAVEPEAAKR